MSNTNAMTTGAAGKLTRSIERSLGGCTIKRAADQTRLLLIQNPQSRHERHDGEPAQKDR